MHKQILVEAISRLPQGLVSRAWGWVARQRHPRLGVALLNRAFATAARIDMSEAEAGLGSYSSLEELFTRKLRPGARRIDPDPAALVCPVDGRVGAMGVIRDGLLFQVKGRSYRLGRLLDDDAAAARFEGGQFLTLYLSPRDYHRIHVPVSGQVRAAALIPGALLPVFEDAVASVEELFAQNERLITYIDNADAGTVAVVKVGATLVGRIRVAYDQEIHTNRLGQLRRRLRYEQPHLVSKGAELGRFEMGSTVILLTEPGRVVLEELPVGRIVRVGQRIGTLATRAKPRRSPSPRTNKKRSAKSSGSRTVK